MVYRHQEIIFIALFIQIRGFYNQNEDKVRSILYSCVTAVLISVTFDLWACDGREFLTRDTESV